MEKSLRDLLGSSFGLCSPRREREESRLGGGKSISDGSHHRPQLALRSVLDLSTSMWTSRWVQAAADKGRDLGRQQYSIKGSSQRGRLVEGRQLKRSEQRPNASFSSRSKSWQLTSGPSAWLCFFFPSLEAAPPGCQQAPFLGRKASKKKGKWNKLQSPSQHWS